MSLRLRAAAYSPNGARLGILPTPQALMGSMVLGDVGGFSISYPLSGPKAPWLGGACEVALEVSYDDGQTWTEPNDARFLRLRRKGDQVEAPNVVVYEGPSYLWLLDKSPVLPEGALNAEGKRPFLTATVGTIVRTLADEAKARGELPGLDVATFSAATDSNGAAWGTVVTLYYEPGISLLTILRNLFDQGLCDFTMVGRSLRIYKPETVMGGASGATLLKGRDLTEAPYQGTLEGIASHAFLMGDGGVTFERTNPTAPTPWGRWTTFISQGGVSDTGTMTALSDAALALAAEERVENTYGLDFSRAKALPFRDYGLGKTVAVAAGNAVPEALRLRQVTLTRDEKGAVQGNVVLNDRFLENEVRQSRRIQGITGGSSLDGGSGGRPDDGLDRTTPKAPTGLTVGSTAYLDDEGKTFALVTLAWAAPTQNTDNTALTDLQGYEAFWRLPGQPWSSMGVTSSVTISMGGFQPNTTYDFTVQAIDNASPPHKSALAAAVTDVTEQDATVPTRPSQPIVTPYLGVLLIEWDGKVDADNNGIGDGPPPLDFAAVEFHVGTATGFVPSAATLVDTATNKAGGSTAVAGLTYGGVYVIKLVMVDRAGNRSPESFYTLAIPNKAATGDIESITANQITAGIISAAITVSGRIATALTGQRVELNNTGLKAYDAGGVNTVAINTDGSATITGTYQTATSGRRLEISTVALNNGYGADGQHSLKFYPATLTGGWTASGMFPDVATSGSNQGNALVLQGSQKLAAPFTGSSIYLGMQSMSIQSTGPTGATTQITLSEGSGRSSLSLSAQDMICGPGVGGTLSLGGGSLTHSNGTLNLTDDTGTMRLYGAADGTSQYLRSQIIYNRTYASGATVVMTTLGTLGRLTSLERNKVNIDREWEAKADLCAIKGLAATTFYDRGNAERYAEWSALPDGIRGADYDADFPRRILGLIAEDVQALGLDDLLQYDENGVLTGVAYERVAIALLPWLHDLERRMAAQESSLVPVGSSA